MKKLAMIGCGGIGGYHLKHLLQFQDIELSGFCDLIPERAEAFATRSGGRAFTDYRLMYEAVAPDLVFICVPPTAHGEIEMTTIRRRIPFFVEKPVALDLQLACDIRDAAAEAGLITAAGFQCRYSNLVDATRAFLEAHEVAFIQCARIGSVPDVPWWKSRATSGGQIVEQTIHQFDLIRYVYGEPQSLYTFGTRGFVRDIPGYDNEDLTVTAVRFQKGGLGSLSTGCYASSGAAFDSKITFGASDCRLDHYLLSRTDQYGGLSESDATGAGGLVISGDGTLAAQNGDAARTVRDDGQAGIRCDRTFIDAVLSGDASKIRSPYADAVRSLAFTLACNQSLDTGLPVTLE